MKRIFDHYTFNARLTPAFLCGLPLALAVMAWFPHEFWAWSTLWGFLVAAGFTKLLSEVGRDKGKEKERKLWQFWGGAPTTRHLRHSGPLDVDTRSRYHKKLCQLIPNLTIPDPYNEHSNRQEADRIYESCTSWLKERTRDQKLFPLVYKELVSYGFRRNLWGLKPFGIFISILALVAIAMKYFISLNNSQSLPILIFPAAIITVALFLVWLFWIRPEWIKIPADGYAQRLLASLDSL